MKMVARPTTENGTRYVSYWFWCPGCDDAHRIDDTWGWNADTEKPTFTPSVLSEGSGNIPRCHSFITDGVAQFLQDSTHAMAGQTVALPDIPAWLYNEAVV